MELLKRAITVIKKHLADKTAYEWTACHISGEMKSIIRDYESITMDAEVKPDACRWTDDRLDELEKLVEIIQTLNTINQGSSFLQKMEKLIYESKLLDNSSIVEHRDSFLRFLNNLAIEDRGKHSV